MLKTSFSVPAAALVFLAALGVMVLPGCDDGERPTSESWLADWDTIGDTVVVRTISGSVWGEPAALEEDLTIGVLEGPDELMFGDIIDMAVDAQGGIYVFDVQVPALRYFNAEGKYVRTLGREGSGPGEYRRSVWGLAVRSDGKVVMVDRQNARLNLFEPDGRPADEWPLASVPYSALTLDTSNHAYLRIRVGPYRRDGPTEVGLLHLDSNGAVVDTIPAPQIAGEPESAPSVFWPSKQWAWSPLGYMIVGVNRDYSFEVRPPGRPVVRIERMVEPVQLHPEERADYEGRDRWMREHGAIALGREMRAVPERKPPYRGLYTGERGRIWVQRHTVAEKLDPAEVREPDPNGPPPITWREPIVFDVFEPDGTYLGEVRMPPRTSAMVFRGDTIWGIRTGELDEEYVVRLVIAGEE